MSTDTAHDQDLSSLPPVHESWLPREHSLYRPRHGGQGLALVCAAVFFCVPILGYTVGVRPAAVENHQPRSFPSPLDGWGFLTGLSPWATDNLPFRDLAIQAEDDISRSVFGEPPSYGDAPRTGPIPSTGDSSGDSPSGGENVPSAGFPTVVEGKDGWLFYGYDLRGKCRPNRPLDQTIANVQRLRTAVERSGRRFVLVVAPDKSTMVPEKLPDSYAGKACAAGPRQEFWQRANAELRVVDLRQALEREVTRRNGPLYFPQDTHWNFAGGLTMTREVAERLRPGVTSTWSSTLGPQWESEADLPKMIGRTGVNRAIRYSLAPDGGTDRTNFGATDFGRTLYFDTPPASGTVDTSVTMFADSFAQFATPYLAATFTRISVTHLTTLADNPRGVANSLRFGETVVIEVVERNLAAGNGPVSDPAVIDVLVEAIAANPLR